MVYNVCKVAVVLCLGCGLLIIYLKLDDSVHLSEPLGRNHHLLEKEAQFHIRIYLRLSGAVIPRNQMKLKVPIRSGTTKA